MVRCWDITCWCNLHATRHCYLQGVSGRCANNMSIEGTYDRSNIVWH